MSEIKPENKLCWFCTEFLYENAYPDYSEYTPGEDFRMLCLKRHWEFSASHTSQADFAKMLASARTCSDFVPLKSLT